MLHAYYSLPHHHCAKCTHSNGSNMNTLLLQTYMMRSAVSILYFWPCHSHGRGWLWGQWAWQRFIPLSQKTVFVQKTKYIICSWGTTFYEDVPPCAITVINLVLQLFHAILNFIGSIQMWQCKKWGKNNQKVSMNSIPNLHQIYCRKINSLQKPITHLARIFDKSMNHSKD